MDVRVTDTIEELHRLQNEFNLWNQGLVAVSMYSLYHSTFM